MLWLMAAQQPAHDVDVLYRRSNVNLLVLAAAIIGSTPAATALFGKDGINHGSSSRRERNNAT